MIETTPSILEWGQLVTNVSVLGAIILALIIISKAVPHWKEIKLKELDIKKGDSEVREKEAAALTQLAAVLESIAVEQRRATETIEIMQRVNADASERLTSSVHTLNERLDRVENMSYQHLTEVTQQIENRVERLEEKYVESQATRA